MGFANRIDSSMQSAADYVDAARKALRARDLDELTRALVSLGQAAAEALGELYESAGPLKPPALFGECDHPHIDEAEWHEVEGRRCPDCDAFVVKGSQS